MTDDRKEPLDSSESKKPPSQKVREPSRHESRMQCIDRYERESSKSKNPLVANLSAMNCTLMRLSAALDNDINDVVANGDKLSRERSREVRDTIDTQLKVTRQVTRFAQLSDDIAARDARNGGS